MLITALVATPGPLAAKDLDSPYAERIEHVDEWGRVYPGYLPALASPLNDIGLVAGIIGTPPCTAPYAAGETGRVP
jgi:hypothetical protein